LESSSLAKKEEEEETLDNKIKTDKAMLENISHLKEEGWKSDEKKIAQSWSRVTRQQKQVKEQKADLQKEGSEYAKVQEQAFAKGKQELKHEALAITKHLAGQFQTQKQKAEALKDEERRVADARAALTKHEKDFAHTHFFMHDRYVKGEHMTKEQAAAILGKMSEQSKQRLRRHMEARKKAEKAHVEEDTIPQAQDALKKAVAGAQH